MTRFSLTDNQKDLLRSIVLGLEDGTISGKWIYHTVTGGIRVETIISLKGKEGDKQIECANLTTADFAALKDAGLILWQDNGWQGSVTLFVQKIIDAVKSDFGENQNTSVAQKIEAVFGEPSSDPDFQCDIFLVMPFRPELDNVFKVLKSLATDLNIVMKRGDEFSSLQNVVINDVWSAINRCRLVMGDCTAIEKTLGNNSYKELNGNVYYEIGIADALHKPILLLTRNMDDVPFDLKHRRFVVYQHAFNLYDSLKPTIMKMLKISK